MKYYPTDLHTVSDVKDFTQASAPYFFSRKTLRFFGQTMRSFKIKTSPNGNKYIYAPMRDNGKLVGYTFRHVTKDGRLASVDIGFPKTLDKILAHIEAN